nr:MAG TPA: hypothetical protein [Bacteriophage sp.]
MLIFMKNLLKNLDRVLTNVFSMHILNNIMRTLVKNLGCEIKYITARQYCRVAILSEYFNY